MAWQFDLKSCGIVTGSHTAATTSITVGSGEGARFAVSPRKLVIYEASYYDNPAEAVALGKGEIVVQTLQASDVLTVLRATDGTTALDMTDANKVFFICNFVDAQMGGELINVVTFGAVGDGAADDTDSVHLAITQAGQGGSVFFPAGTYKLTTWPDAGHDYGQRTFLGEGTASVVDGPATALFVDVSDEIYCHGLDFTGWSKVFEFDPITSSIDRICIEMCRFSGINRPLGWSNPDSGGSVENFSILNCAFSSLTERAIFMHGAWNQMTVDGCRFQTCVDGCIQLGKNVAADAADWKNTSVTNNSIKTVTTTSTSLRAIQVYGFDVVVSGNSIDDLSGATSLTEAILCHTQRGIITNNTILDIDGSAGSAGYGISIQGDDLSGDESASPPGYNIVVSGNIIDMSDTVDSRGIILGNDNIVCSNNVITNVRDIGITSDNQGSRTHSNISVIGNRVDFGTVNTANGYGIIFQTSGSGYNIVGNIITGAHRGMQLAGSVGSPSDYSIVGNSISAALVGIRFNPSVVVTGVRIQDNYISGATTGVSFEGTALDLVQLTFNVFNSVTTNVALSAAPTNFIRIEKKDNTLEIRNRLEIITGADATDGWKVTAGTTVVEITQDKGFEVTTGGLTVSASGASITGGVTAVTGGLTATAGGVTAVAGDVDIQSGDLFLHTGVGLFSGTGVPGTGLGSKGSIFLRTDGGQGSTLYYKYSSTQWKVIA